MSDEDQRSSDAAEVELRFRAKRGLRSRLKSVRAAIPKSARMARNEAISNRLLAVPEYASAKTILAYAAMNSEADPTTALAEARQAGVSLAYPRIDFERERLEIHLSDPPTEPGGYGILEPSPEAPICGDDRVDVVLVPGLAVEPGGHRIGYGKGFYDSLLPRLPRAFRIMVAFDFQLIAEVPHTPTDIPVDCIVTDQRVLRCRVES